MNHSHDNPPEPMVRQMANSVEITVNLVYLIKMDSNSPKQVRLYASRADEPIRCLFDIIGRERERTTP